LCCKLKTPDTGLNFKTAHQNVASTAGPGPAETVPMALIFWRQGVMGGEARAEPRPFREHWSDPRSACVIHPAASLPLKDA
jgi:hypothetical protein